MAILLAIYSVIKFVASLVFKGPLNFNVEMLFWIFNGIIFGPLKGMLFSTLCDTTFTFFTTGIGYWMIEYAIVPPLVSIVSWLFWKGYKDKSKISIWISLVSIVILLTSTLSIFFIQLINNKFRYENVSANKVIPAVVYGMISFCCVSIVSFTLFCLIMFKIRKEWKYIKWLYIMTIVIFVIIIFRWIWGPYAFIEYMKRFNSKSIDFAKQYPLSLFGIVTKSCITIPLAISVAIPVLNIIDKFKNNNDLMNKY